MQDGESAMRAAGLPHGPADQGRPVTAGEHRALPEYLRQGLDVVFVGYNPGERSARVGHYYAGRGNRFWPLLYESGLVPEPLTYQDDVRATEFGIGLTDLVGRWTRSSADLSRAELAAGAAGLREKLLRCRPRVVAFTGKGAYEALAGRRCELGLQAERLGRSLVFVLPSPSARNGRMTRAGKLAWYRRLAELVASLRGTGHNILAADGGLPAGRRTAMAEKLAAMTCVACRADEPTVTEAEIAEYHPQVPEWRIVEVDGVKRLTRRYRFPDFRTALAFTIRVGEAAEEQGHHPAILTEWGRVTVSWWTHAIQGLHRNDFIMAAKTDLLYAESGTEGGKRG